MFKLNFRNQVLAGFAVSIVLVLVVGVLSFKSIKQLEGDTVWVDHTQTVIKKTNSLLQLLIDGETGMRGYGATANKKFLDPYNDAVPRVTENLNQLSNLVQDNPTQVKRIDSLKLIVNRQLVILKTNIETREAKGLDYMIANSMFLNGKGNMDSIRDINNRIIETENTLLAERKAASDRASDQAIIVIVIGCTIFLLIVVIMFYYIQATFARQKRVEEEVRVANIELEKVLIENESKNWLLTGSGNLNERMQGQQSEKELSENILSEISKYANAVTGTLYLFDENEEKLNLYASYAFNDPSALKQSIRISEGWIGQAAKDERAAVVKGKLNDKLLLGSSILEDELIETFIVPFFFDKKLKGVLEVGFRNEVQEQVKDYILLVANDIGIAVNTSQARTIMHDLFEETQQQAEELEAQQEEMRVTNEELVNKTEMLQASEEELRVQQEELRTINAELEEKASLLEEKNQAIEEARQIHQHKRLSELETTGRYKSEFLANMSHELRTPLNSILVLARILKDNKPLNLSEDQIKYASVIFNAGNDLLTLINDILDLSKIESGKLDMQNEDIEISEILGDGNHYLQRWPATKRSIIAPTIRECRLLSLPIRLGLNRYSKTCYPTHLNLRQSMVLSAKRCCGPARGTVSFKIKDSGIGIPADKQRIIFEAFQQADGSTSRKYGGTGLGLSISRELASFLLAAI
jgi:signal transduction histidine kinase/CHASE3 domain sensor protein